MKKEPLFMPFSSIAVCRTERKGLGVFAMQSFVAGELIERAPVLIIPAILDHGILKFEISNYVFDWDNDDMAVVLGYGSFYNHSYSPNARYELHYRSRMIEFFALQEIRAGDEILVNYNGDPNDHGEVWFEVY